MALNPYDEDGSKYYDRPETCMTCGEDLTREEEMSCEGLCHECLAHTYKCPKCGEDFDVRDLEDLDSEICPKCSEEDGE